MYTYGRYGELGKDKSSARNTSPTGEGVLIKLTGRDAISFIQDQMLGTAGGAGGFFAAEAQGYVSKSTLTTLHVAGSDYYNKIYVTVTGDATDESNLETTGTRVYNDLDDNGITIGNYSVVTINGIGV